MFERTLRLRSPQLGAGHIDFPQAVGFFANTYYLLRIADGIHRFSPFRFSFDRCLVYVHTLRRLDTLSGFNFSVPAGINSKLLN